MREGRVSIRQSGVLTALFCLLHAWCHVKLMLSRRTFDLHHTTGYQFTVLFEATYLGFMLFFSLPPALLAE